MSGIMNIMKTTKLLRNSVIFGLLSIALLVGMTATAQQNSDIGINIAASPLTFDVEGTGLNDHATVTFTLTAPATTSGPIDLVLILDTSTSVDFEVVQEIASEFIAHLSANDQIAIVTFSDVAQLQLGLTSDKSQAMAVVNALIRGNQTAMGDGMMLGLDELIQNGRSNATQAVVMPTDGVHNVGSDPLVQATRAAENNIPIYPIGTSPAARDLVLFNIADESSGRYFSSYSDSALQKAMELMGRAVVAHYVHIIQTVPFPLRFHRALVNAPDVSLGTEVTRLEWYIRFLFEGQTWESQYEIGAFEDATSPLFQHPSTIEYRTDDNELIVLRLQDVATSNPTLTAGQGSGIPDDTNGTTDPDDGNGTDGSTNGENNGQQTGSDQLPVISIAGVDSATTYLTGEAIPFDLSGTNDPDGRITLLEIDWSNDGIIDENIADPDFSMIYRHAYARAGEYTVRIRVTDNGGHTAEQLITVTIEEGLLAIATHATDFSSSPTTPEWMDYYIEDGVVTDEETRDASARFSADVFIPGTEYRLTEADLTAIIALNELHKLIATYESMADVQAAGYVSVGAPVPGVGQHYANEAYLRGTPQAAQPPVLLFDGDKLVAVRYFSTDQAAMLFQISGWASHPASAHYADGTETAASDINNITDPNTAGSEFVFWHPQLYGLTVWVGAINPNGLFASSNPNIQ